MEVNRTGSAPHATPCTCASLRRTARAVSRLYDRALRPAGVGVNQFTILANVVREGGLSISGLAERLEMDRTTLTRNLRPLVRAGWVLVATGSDRRQRAVGLTRAGREVHDRAYPLWQAAERRMREALGPEAGELRRLLDATLRRTAGG